MSYHYEYGVQRAAELIRGADQERLARAVRRPRGEGRRGRRRADRTEPAPRDTALRLTA